MAINPSKHSDHDRSVSIKLRTGEDGKLYLCDKRRVASVQSDDEIGFHRNVIDKVIGWMFKVKLIKDEDKNMPGVLGRVMYSHNARIYAMRYTGQKVPYEDAQQWIKANER